MWMYEGQRDPNVPGPKNVTIFRQGGGQSVLRQYIVKHSPDGFNWGYSGSGPADLALNMLFDCLKRDGWEEAEAKTFATAHYQLFKEEFIEDVPNHLRINSGNALDWVELIKEIDDANV